MIYGIGVDIAEISKIADAAKKERFLSRIFSPIELAYLKERNFTPQSIAANFAAKEAFSKAIGTGVRGFSLKEVQLIHDHSGKPSLCLIGKAKEISDRLCINHYHVSISHAGDIAICFVVAETD